MFADRGLRSGVHPTFPVGTEYGAAHVAVFGSLFAVHHDAREAVGLPPAEGEALAVRAEDGVLQPGQTLLRYRTVERIGFFDEKVDVDLDGERQERPKTGWS